MSDPAAPRLLPMLAGGNGVPPNPATYQFEPKLDGSPHSSDLCQVTRRGDAGMSSVLARRMGGHIEPVGWIRQTR